jgi:hypothetical protein
MNNTNYIALNALCKVHKKFDPTSYVPCDGFFSLIASLLTIPPNSKALNNAHNQYPLFKHSYQSLNQDCTTHTEAVLAMETLVYIFIYKAHYNLNNIFHLL